MLVTRKVRHRPTSNLTSRDEKDQILEADYPTGTFLFCISSRFLFSGLLAILEQIMWDEYGVGVSLFR